MPAPWARRNPFGPFPLSRPVTSPPTHSIFTSLTTAANVERTVSVAGMELVVHDTPKAMVDAAAQRIADLMAAGEGERFTLGLAGGSTPAATYTALRERATGWSKVDAWLSDERWVPQDSDRSNGHMAAETLLDHVDATFHRPRWSKHLKPEDAAAHYEAAIRSIHPESRPDLILLGMGDDGHTASLFPGTPALDEGSRWIVANDVPQQGETRLTSTFPLLWSARQVLFLVTGAGKAGALRDSFEGKTPAGQVGEGNAEVEWHVDTAAASLFS